MGVVLSFPLFMFEIIRTGRCIIDIVNMHVYYYSFVGLKRFGKGTLEINCLHRHGRDISILFAKFQSSFSVCYFCYLALEAKRIKFWHQFFIKPTPFISYRAYKDATH